LGVRILGLGRGLGGISGHSIVEELDIRVFEL
jgi:hypothetical protein